MKINLVIGTLFTPRVVDDDNVKHEYALILESERQDYRVILGLDPNPDEPYWHRTLELNKIIYLRDELTKLINSTVDNK